MQRLKRFGIWLRRHVNSVRGRLILLTISLLVPALLSMAFLLIDADRHGRAQQYQQMLTTARALSGAIDRQAAVGIAVAETLASDQALMAGDWAAFHARARRVTDERSGWVVVSDISGQQLLNTRVPYGQPLPRSARAPELTQSLLAGHSKVSDLRMGVVARAPVVTVAAPVTINGQVHILAYVVEAASFASVFRQQRVPDRWVASLLDGKHKVIARSLRNEVWMGHSATPDAERILRESNEGVAPSRSLDGVPTIMAYTRSPQTGWTLVVALPRADLSRVVTASVIAATGIFLLLLLLGIGLALFFSRGVNREMDRLVAAAEAIGQGQPVDPPADGLEETAAIHAALNRASGELLAREERQATMINELNHRVKNTLATVQALARQTFGKADSLSVEVFTDRLIALSAAHDLLTRTGWREADLAALMRACTRAHGDRVRCSGGDVALNAHTAVALSMVFHELATNSAKYGALSADGGKVSIGWRIDPSTEGLAFTWIEEGGPPVAASSQPGFGTRLIESTIRRELKGTVHLDFRAKGLVFKAVLPLSGAVRWSNSF